MQLCNSAFILMRFKNQLKQVEELVTNSLYMFFSLPQVKEKMWQLFTSFNSVSSEDELDHVRQKQLKKINKAL